MRKREEGEMGGVVGIIMTSGVVTPVGKGIREAYGAAPHEVINGVRTRLINMTSTELTGRWAGLRDLPNAEGGVLPRRPRSRPILHTGQAHAPRVFQSRRPIPPLRSRVLLGAHHVHPLHAG